MEKKGKLNIYSKDQQKKVAQAIAALEKNYQELITKKTNLEKQGIINASPCKFGD